MNKLKRNKNNSSNERTFLIEKIVGKKQEQGVSKYKVKWVGYDDKDNTWEPLVNLKGCEDLIADYEKSLIQEERILGKKLKRDNNFNEFEATPLPSSEKKYNRYKEIPATNTKQTKLQRTKSNGSPILKSNSLRSSVLSPTRKEDVETVTIPPNLEDKPSRNKLKEAVDKRFL